MAEHQVVAGYALRAGIVKQAAWWNPLDADTAWAAGGGLYLTEENFGDKREFKIVPGATGFPAQMKARRRAGKIMPDGGFSTPLTADRFGLLMEMMFGTYSVLTATFANPTALPVYQVQIDKAGIDAHLIRNFRAARISLASNENDGDLIFSVEGFATHYEDDYSFSATPVGPASPVLQHYESVLTLGGTAYRPKSINLSVDHMLDVDHRNSQNPIAIHKAAPRLVVAQVELDWNDATEALYELYQAGTAFTFSLVYTTGTTSLTLASAANACFFDQGFQGGISHADRSIPLTLQIMFTATNALQNDELSAVVDDS